MNKDKISGTIYVPQNVMDAVDDAFAHYQKAVAGDTYEHVRESHRLTLFREVYAIISSWIPFKDWVHGYTMVHKHGQQVPVWHIHATVDDRNTYFIMEAIFVVSPYDGDESNDEIRTN
jgi:hypothetical protein